MVDYYLFDHGQPQSIYKLDLFQDTQCPLFFVPKLKLAKVDPIEKYPKSSFVRMPQVYPILDAK